MTRLLVSTALLLSLALSAQQAPRPKIICTMGSATAIKIVKPIYPKEAKERKISGKVVLEVEINRLGEPRNINIRSGPQIFLDSSLEAIRQWRWKPYELNGQAVEVDTVVTLNFKLQPNSPKRF
jgi:periplasmic protein TonB